jgi:hypothetical protein
MDVLARYPLSVNTTLAIGPLEKLNAPQTKTEGKRQKTEGENG